MSLPEIIRTTSENPDFRRLVKELDEDLYERNGDIQKQFDQYNKIDMIKHAVIILFDGEPVGCGCFKRHDECSVEIKRMFVKHAYRGKKLAAAMLNELEQWAMEEGFSVSVLETGRRQREAHHLYEKSGYTLTENYGQYIGMDDSICYRKALKK